MNKEKLEACTKKVLADMARKRGIAGWRSMRKDQLIKALSAAPKQPAPQKRLSRMQKGARIETQRAAARNTSQTASAEEQVERSKYETGVATKDLSAKVPKDLPG